MFPRSIFIICCLAWLQTGCRKKLEGPVASNIAGIDSLVDCERLLNDYALFHEQPVSGELSADNYYIREQIWSQVPVKEQNIYRWAADIFEGQGGFRDYNKPYMQTYTVNEILKALPNIVYNATDQPKKDLLEGSAFFYRAQAHYNLLQLFARPYNQSTALTDTGIVLRLTPDITVFKRAGMQESYAQVIKDLMRALALLPQLPDAKNRYLPSQTAVWAFLARVYLSMRDYDRAGFYADTCLQHYNYLLNFDDGNYAQPFTESNPEVILQGMLNPFSRIIPGRLGNDAFVDSLLYRSYQPGDLRQRFFYRLAGNGKPLLQFNYTANLFCFGGLATDEVYLIRAECRARQGQLQEAMNDLNYLLAHRFITGIFHPLPTGSANVVLEQILTERRKELAFRGLRWTDLRRLNKERPGSPIRRTIDRNTYSLLPNDLRYTFPIPPDALQGSEIVQNSRD
jgi:hypothetical protein